MKLMNSKKITYTGIMMALVFVGTFLIKWPTATGYIHLGDAFVFLSGLILGPVYGALAAGIGSALADIIGGYAVWALPTFLIKGLMAAVVGYLALKKDNKKVIFLSGTVFTLLWVGFNVIARFLLSLNITQSSTNLIGEDTGIHTITELLSRSSSVQNILLIAALLVPIFMWFVIYLLKKFKVFNFNSAYSLSFVIAGSLMIVLYFIASTLMYGNYVIRILEIPANMVQFIFGLIIVHLLLPFTQRLIQINTHASAR